MSLVSNITDLATRVATEMKKKAGAYPSAWEVTGTKANGALGTSDDGLAWIATGAVIPQYFNGAITYPGGTAANGSGAWYAIKTLAGPCIRVSTYIRYAASDSTAHGAAMGIFTNSAGNNTTSSPAHLAVNPQGFEFAVFQNGTSNFIKLPPNGHTESFVRFPCPLKTDGSTLHHVEMLLDRDNSTCYVRVGDAPVVSYTHPYIGQFDARYPFIEGMQNSTSEPVASFIDPSADYQRPHIRNPLAPLLTAVRGMANARVAGSGTAYQRPSSRMIPGSTFFDSTTNKLSISDGQFWRDPTTGTIVGNIFPHTVSRPTDSNFIGYLAGAGTKSRSTAQIPGPGHQATYKVVAADTSNQSNFFSYYPTVTAGQVYTPCIGNIMCPTGSITAYIQISFYNDSNAQVGTTTSGSTVNLAAGVWGQTPVVSPTVPSGATKALIGIVWAPPAAGAALHMTDLSLAPGTLTGALRS